MLPWASIHFLSLIQALPFIAAANMSAVLHWADTHECILLEKMPKALALREEVRHPRPTARSNASGLASASRKPTRGDTIGTWTPTNDKIGWPPPHHASTATTRDGNHRTNAGRAQPNTVRLCLDVDIGGIGIKLSSMPNQSSIGIRLQY